MKIMNNGARVFATGMIWAALTILGVAAMVSRVAASGGIVVFIMTALIAGATIGTYSVWRGANANVSAREEAEKAKRRSRIERLMDDLDERDIDELRFRLMNHDDEESVPLEELMQKGQER